VENNNEQQSQNTCGHPKFWQLARENPSLGKPAKRDLLLSSGSINSYGSNTWNQEKIYKHPQLSHNFCLETHAQNSVLLYNLAKFNTSKIVLKCCCMVLFVRPSWSKKTHQTTSKIVPQSTSIFMLTFMLYDLYRSIQYGLPLSNKI
jgi:hypothetical protein